MGGDRRMYSGLAADKEEKRHQRALRIVKRLWLMDDDFRLFGHIWWVGV